MKINRTITILGLACISISSILLFSCRGRAVKTGMLVATEAPANIPGGDYVNGDLWRYIPEARIVAFIPGKPASAKVLTNDFYSACSPEISYDGRLMLFTAQQIQDDPWQIWEMDLESLKSRKITSFRENCTDPAYLPNGKLVFSKLTVNDTVRNAHCLFTCDPDGSGLKQITFSPSTIFATTVLRDGRLLTISRQTFPGNGDPFLMVMRPDGTKADMFYQGTAGCKLTTSACETADGKVVFVESDRGLSGNVISIKYNRPLHTRSSLTTGIGGDFCFVLPVKQDQYLVSFRRTDSERFSLYDFDPGKNSLREIVFSDPVYDVVEVIGVKERELPKKLPSEVDLQVKTGLLLCQDINFLNQPDVGQLSGIPKAGKIEVLGIDTTYGVVQVEKDGSFYLKVMADTPFRIRTLDEKGNTVDGPCSWLWLRPNERRGCIGCHEDPELAPENRVSLAVRKAPVIIPVHISDIKEKIVDLE
jgi:hypothetical protein